MSKQGAGEGYIGQCFTTLGEAGPHDATDRLFAGARAEAILSSAEAVQANLNRWQHEPGYADKVMAAAQEAKDSRTAKAERPIRRVEARDLASIAYKAETSDWGDRYVVALELGDAVGVVQPMIADEDLAIVERINAAHRRVA